MHGYLRVFLRLGRSDTLLGEDIHTRPNTYHNEIWVNLVYLCKKEAEKTALRTGDVNSHRAILNKIIIIIYFVHRKIFCNFQNATMYITDSNYVYLQNTKMSLIIINT